MMKLKVQQVFDATLVLARIINEGRPMPQKGKYRMARMHAKLLPEWTPINAQRDALITAYDHHPVVKDAAGNDTGVLSDQFAVPADKAEEFNAAWKAICDEEIEVEVEPIPLAQLDLGDSIDGAITANELVTLGDLVRE